MVIEYFPDTAVQVSCRVQFTCNKGLMLHTMKTEQGWMAREFVQFSLDFGVFYACFWFYFGF